MTLLVNDSVEFNVIIFYCFYLFLGGSLDKYGHIPEHILGRMAVFMVEGLCYMWALKILHRGIIRGAVMVVIVW